MLRRPAAPPTCSRAGAARKTASVDGAEHELAYERAAGLPTLSDGQAVCAPQRGHTENGMILPMSGGALIREARRRAGSTQAELARRMGTSQSAVARWENGVQAPAHDKVRRAVEACGFDLGVTITPRDDQTVTLFDEYLALTPQQRVERLLATLRVQQALQKARRVDPAA